MKELILIGGGGHCRSCIDVIETQNAYRIAGIVDLPERVGSEVLGYPVIGSDDQLAEIITRYDSFLITLGQIKSPERRIGIFERLVKAGANLATIVSPRAHVSRHAKIGPGSIIMHDALVNAGASIGANCIVNSKALIEHDATIADHCHISTAAVINGGVSVGAGSFVGSNAVTRQEVCIGREVIIGGGVSVMQDVGDGCLFLGKREQSR